MKSREFKKCNKQLDNQDLVCLIPEINSSDQFQSDEAKILFYC